MSGSSEAMHEQSEEAEALRRARARATAADRHGDAARGVAARGDAARRAMELERARTARNEAAHRVPRARMSQQDVPTWSLREAADLAAAVHRLTGLHGRTTPAALADSIGETAASSSFRTLTAASVAYGLTEGGAQADEISLASLGRQLLNSTGGRESHQAVVAALLRPRLLGELLNRYDGMRWPPVEAIRAELVSAGYPGAPARHAAEVVDRNVRDAGLLMEPAPGTLVLSLRAPAPATPPAIGADGEARGARFVAAPDRRSSDGPSRALEGRRRVFLAGDWGPPTGELVELLMYGGFAPVSAPKGSGPIDPAAINAMRSCTAAVVRLSTDSDRPGELDKASLVLVGAAATLYGSDAVFLWPPELHTLPEDFMHLRFVRYPGRSLDYPSTMALLREFNDIGGTP